MLKNPDGTVLTYDGITSVIKNERGQVAFEVITDGYAKGGIHVLIGVSDNGVDGISFIELGETPGLGSKVKEKPEFAQQFIGVNSDNYSFTAITGATYSSKGMKKAVDTAVSAYQNHKGEIINE
ncbi:MAG: FMN-binding protein [Oscillospiraceae bacterium]|nr:FMN-binding protein [Oscillospiraceae bacterium]